MRRTDVYINDLKKNLASSLEVVSFLEESYDYWRVRNVDKSNRILKEIFDRLDKIKLLESKIKEIEKLNK